MESEHVDLLLEGKEPKFQNLRACFPSTMRRGRKIWLTTIRSASCVRPMLIHVPCCPSPSTWARPWFQRYKAAIDNDLSTVHLPKGYFGFPELRLFFQGEAGTKSIISNAAEDKALLSSDLNELLEGLVQFLGRY